MKQPFPLEEGLTDIAVIRTTLETVSLFPATVLITRYFALRNKIKGSSVQLQ
jgi:hypothetical protein